MNTIRRPRKRPRKDSMSFRTLGWLLVREASYVVVHSPLADESDQIARDWWLGCSTARARSLATSVIRRAPGARYFP